MQANTPPDTRKRARVGNDKKSGAAGSRSATAAATAAEGSMKQQKRGVKTAAFGTQAGPSHVLFSAFFAGSSPATTSPSSSNSNSSSGTMAKTRENRQRCLRIDPRLERDYIYKRKRRAHQSADWSASASSSSRTTTTTIGTCSWEGVSKVEKDLVECCESLQDDFYSPDHDEETDDDGDDDEVDATGGGLLSSDLSSSSALGSLPLSSPANSIAGVLAIEKETRFAAILSKGCHNMASRSLALAILERTLEVHLAEEATRALLLQQSKEKSQDTTNNGSSDSRTKDGERVTRTRLQVGKDGGTVSDDAATPTAKDSKQRFELFFAAGGLRILNQWLIDASSHDTTKSSPTTKGKNNNKNENPSTTPAIRKPHPTRPIALSILLFLEHVPFEKTTVKNSKINKQIQKLGKKVASIQEAHQNGQAPQEDLENWMTLQKKPIAHSEALTRVQLAVDAVKASWREKAKIKGDRKQVKPFEALQLKIKERLHVLNQFETGALSTRPEWYRPAATAASLKKKSPLKRKAMNEAEIEKLKIQKKIKQVQSRSQKSLQQLREKLRRRQVEQNQHTHSAGRAAVNSVSSFSDIRKVTWKDGLKSQVVRNRQILEEVFLFGNDLPPSAGWQEDSLVLSSDQQQ